MRRTIHPWAVAALVVLAGCSAEPDFDEKFETRSRELNAQAQKIEAESNAQLSAAREAEQAVAESREPNPVPLK